MTAFLPGIVLVVLGGALNGSFTAPMKFSRQWGWENTWLVYSVVGLLAFPIGIALLSVPHLASVYQSADSRAVTLAIVFGFGWGIGSVLFGLSIHLLGMALGFGIILGLTAALGSLIPLVVLSPDALYTGRGACVLGGLVIVVFGIILCAKAGGMKSVSAEGGLTRSRFRTGLVLCVGSGVFNAMLNLALAFGAPVAQAAIKRGVSASAAQNAIWALAVSGGSLANISYSVFLLYRNKSWGAFGALGSAKNHLLAALMGGLWMAGVSVYGSGAAALGDLGAVIGWPLFMSTVIITGNVWGFLTGEWKQASRAALSWNLAGVVVLIGAIVIISFGSSL